MDLSVIARSGSPIPLDRPRHLVYEAAATWLLLEKYKGQYLAALYRAPTKAEGAAAGVQGLVLVSMDALIFYLWAGLQADAEAHGETLTLEKVASFVTPRTYPTLFPAVVSALVRDNQNPQPADGDAGKADAAAARPAVAAAPRPKRKASTGPKRKASPSPSSIGRHAASGARPSRSTTSPAKPTSTRSKPAGRKPRIG